MKKVTDIATPAEIVEQLESLNIEDLFKDLVNYAMFKMKGENIVDAEKLVGDVFEKVVTGVRKWNKDYTFKSFLFGSVKSLVSQYNNQYGKKIIEFNYDVETEDIPDNTENDSAQLEKLKTLASATLKKHVPPPDEIEEMVFECWLDEIKKPIEIAKFWDLEITEVYKAIKRLKRKLNPVKELLNSSSNE